MDSIESVTFIFIFCMCVHIFWYLLDMMKMYRNKHCFYCFLWCFNQTWASQMLGKHSTMVLHSQFLYKDFNYLENVNIGKNGKNYVNPLILVSPVVFVEHVSYYVNLATSTLIHRFYLFSSSQL